MTGRVEAVAVAVVRTDPWTRVKSGHSGIDKRTVDGQLYFCKHERPDPELMRCAVEASDEEDYEECLEKFVDR